MKLRRLVVLFFCFASPSASEEAAGLSPAITESDLLAHVSRLASDEWEGRGSGTPGEQRATDYIAAHFEGLGFEPAGEGGTFFQPVRMPDAVKVDEASTFRAGELAFELNREWRPFSLSSSGDALGDLVFLGYGIHAPKLDYDDYAGVDVRGRIVVVFRHMPRGPAWRDPQVRGAHAPFIAKLEQAASRGAIALLVVNDPRNFPAAAPAAAGAEAPSRRGVRRDVVMRGNIGGGEPRIPFAHMTLAAARRLFPAVFGATPEELEKELHAGDKPAPVSRAGRVRARLHVGIERTYLVGRNVCGLLRGGAQGAPANQEVVVIGAHHDHLGRGGGAGSLARNADERKQIHNGADDNASGTSGVLEVAAFLASRKAQLRRSILFLTFTGEERGLLGSRYFVDHPTLPLERMVAMLNMDMIGRLEGRKLFIGGVKTSPVFEPMLTALTREIGVEAAFGDGGRAPSDNTSFYAKKMPVLFFFSGMHRDYHRPSDDADKVDTAGMQRIARLCAATTEAVANLPDRPAFQRADSGGMGPPRAILGITADTDPQGVKIRRAAPEGPAEQAGLAAGDVIVEIAGTKTPDLTTLQDVMRKQKIGARVKLKYLRSGVMHEIEITFGRG